MFWRALYNSVFVPLGWLAFRLYGLLNDKARRGIEGRKRLFPAAAERIAGWGDAPRIWFHASSMGEFEQAKPIIAAVRERHPGTRIAVTFFSPSGYENSLAYREADLISYIPFDSPRNARRFVELLRPSAAVVMRYDLWPNHVWALRRAGIPVILANATLRSGGVRNLPLLRGYHRELYDSLHAILTVSDGDRERCLAYGVRGPAIETAGDTRYDQVARRCEESRKKEILPGTVIAGKTIIVAGSSWGEDERLLVPVLADLCQERGDILVVVVPHEPTLSRLGALEARLNGSLSSIRFSQLVSYAGERVVIVDGVGLLVALYRYAQIAYVGGGFGTGVHNVLEPAVYGVPVVIGPNHAGSHEAGELLSLGGLLSADGAEGLRRIFDRLLADRPYRERIGATAADFVAARRGATGRILRYLENVL